MTLSFPAFFARSCPILLLALLPACGSGSDSGDDDGKEGGGECAAFSDMCSHITLAHVNDTCGVTATETMVRDHVTSDTSSDPANVSSCEYTGNGVAISLERACFPDGASAANLFFDVEHDEPTGGDTQEDVSGLGDEAFYRMTLAIDQVDLYSRQSNIIIDLFDNAIVSEPASRTCLTTLANEMLAL